MRSPDPRRWCSGCGLANDDAPDEEHSVHCYRLPRKLPFDWMLVLVAIVTLCCLAGAIVVLVELIRW